jgi:hypothetical protein
VQYVRTRYLPARSSVRYTLFPPRVTSTSAGRLPDDSAERSVGGADHRAVHLGDHVAGAQAGVGGAARRLHSGHDHTITLVESQLARDVGGERLHTQAVARTVGRLGACAAVCFLHTKLGQRHVDVAFRAVACDAERALVPGCSWSNLVAERVAILHGLVVDRHDHVTALYPACSAAPRVTPFTGPPDLRQPEAAGDLRRHRLDRHAKHATATCPCSMSCDMTLRAMFDGMAKPIPICRPTWKDL